MSEQQDPGPAQQTEGGADNLQGSGEFPPPDAPPTGPAPGTDPERRQEIEDSRADDTRSFKEAIESDPVVGGSGSAPRTERP